MVLVTPQQEAATSTRNLHQAGGTRRQEGGRRQEEEGGTRHQAEGARRQEGLAIGSTHNTAVMFILAALNKILADKYAAPLCIS
jgi:hypothetical protein